jgi:hypothetical protein
VWGFAWVARLMFESTLPEQQANHEGSWGEVVEHVLSV